MKKIFYTLILTTSIFVFGQKKELKQAQKLLDQEFYNEALSVLDNNKDLILNSDKKYHAQYYFLNGWALKGSSRYLEAHNSLSKSIEIERSMRQKKYIENANILMQQAEADLVNSAVEDNKNDDYESASVKLYDAYLMNPNKEDNINYLYFSASSAVNSKLYDTALEYYLKLKNMGYTGVVSEYFVTPVETNVEEKVTQTEWHTVVTRGGLAAKVVEPYLKKGNSVYVEGRLRTRSWEDKDGVTRYTTEVICDNLEMLGKKSDNVESSEATTGSTAPIQDSADDDLPF